MNTRLEFSLTPDDYVEFNQTYAKHRRSLAPPDQRGLLRWTNVFVILAVVGIVLADVLGSVFLQPAAPAPAVPPPPRADPISELITPILPYLLVFGLAFVGFLWLRRSGYLYRRLASWSTRLGEPKIMVITDDKLTLREPGMVMEAEWSYFMRFVESRNCFLLFSTARAAHILPKRAFGSAQEMEEFRGFALAHVGNTPIGLPVQPPK